MIDMLRRVSLFSSVDDQGLKAISNLMVPGHYAKDAMIVQEGELGNSMFIILSGQAKVVFYTSEGREVVLAILEPGSFFGEMALLTDEKRSATVVCCRESQIGQIKRHDFEVLLLDYPRLSRSLLSEMVDRLRHTSLVLERVSTMDVEQRLCAFLQTYCEQNGQAMANGHVCVQLPTHQLMADLLSSSRETVSRSISALRSKGILRALGGRGRMQVHLGKIKDILDRV